MKIPIALVLTVMPIFCVGAPSYTSYFNNVHVYTNITLGGVTRNTWPSSSGIAGTVINTVAESGLLSVDSTKTNGIAATPAHVVSALSAGESSTVLKYTSGLADNSTNRAFIVDTPAWTDGRLISARNNGVDKFFVRHKGNIEIYADAGLYVEDPASDAYSNFDPGAVDLQDINGNSVCWLYPRTPGNNLPYLFSTQAAHSAGDLMRVQNFGTNKVSAAWDGTITIAQAASEPAAPAAGYFTLFGIDNGAGKMILKVRFPTGSSQTIATEP